MKNAVIVLEAVCIALLIGLVVWQQYRSKVRKWWERWRKADDLAALLGPDKDRHIVFY